LKRTEIKEKGGGERIFLACSLKTVEHRAKRHITLKEGKKEQSKMQKGGKIRDRGKTSLTNTSGNPKLF